MAGGSESGPHADDLCVSSRRLAVLLGLALLVVIGPIVANDTAQPASRYSLTASLAEHGSVDLGPYRDRLGVDHAIYRGEWRSDKAPGQPLLGVPAYLVGRAMGAESAAQFHRRLEPCLRQMLCDGGGKSIAVVCHGGVIRLLLAMILDLPIQKMGGFDIEYASLTQVHYQPRKSEIQLLNFTPWRDLR